MYTANRIAVVWDYVMRTHNIMKIIAVFVLLPCGSAAADAATVAPIYGEVLVREDQGFRPVGARTEVAAGAEVLVKPGGSAAVIYADGCMVSVSPLAVAVVQAASPCTKFAPPSYLSASLASPNVQRETRSRGVTPPETVGEHGHDYSTIAVVLGVAIGAAAVGAGVLLGGLGKSKPTSP
jgi:hypothetical protein